jgi:hypothetical protein
MNYIRAVQALVDGEVDFVIIGGWSAVLHGSAYQTNARLAGPDWIEARVRKGKGPSCYPGAGKPS